VLHLQRTSNDDNLAEYDDYDYYPLENSGWGDDTYEDYEGSGYNYDIYDDGYDDGSGGIICSAVYA